MSPIRQDYDMHIIQPRKPHRLSVTLAGSLALFAILAACDDQSKQKTGASPPPVKVTVAAVKQQTIPIVKDFAGTLKAIKSIDIIPRVSGYIDKRHFVEGSYIEAGSPLYLIDPRPYQARLDAYDAQLARDESSLEFWKKEVTRYTKLAKQGAASQEKLEGTIAKRDETLAAIEKDKADIENARLELSYTNITAPFAGRIQNTRINVGELVHAQQDVLTTLVHLDPIYAVFNISRRQLFEVQELQRQGLGFVKNEEFKGEVTRSDGSTYPHQGTLNYVSKQINPATDTFQARLILPNPFDKFGGVALVPGQYVPVRLIVGKQPDALLIPEASLVETQAGMHVYVVGKDSKVEVRKVDVDRSYQQQWVIKKGLKKGEQIIVQGLQKVRSGTVVQIEDAAPAKSNDAAPDEAPQKSSKS